MFFIFINCIERTGCMSEIPFMEKYGPWALLAGAAEGLGEAYTLALAKRGVNIVMADIQSERQKALASWVENESGIRTRTICTDLAQPNAVKEIMQAVEGVDCRLLIYNAAYSSIKPFISYTEKELDSFIAVNAHTSVKLVHAFARRLKDNHTPGGILLMSSLAGLTGMRLVAPYAATKAFARNLAESLHHELREHHIDVMACIAGATATPAYLATQPHYGFFRPQVMSPGKVAESALRKLGRKPLFIPGFFNRLSYFILLRLLPWKTASAIANSTMKKLYSHKAGE
jgi:hypothetical protein